MKYSTPTTLLLVLTVISIASCSKDKSDDGPTPPTSTDNLWKLNDFGFSRSVSLQNTTTYTNGNPFTQVNIDSKIATSNVNLKPAILFFGSTPIHRAPTALNQKIRWPVLLL